MKKREFNWGPGLFIIAYHVLLVALLPLYLLQTTPSFLVCLVAFVLYFATGISITAGYHRLYAHRAYKAHPVVECALLWFGSLATQGSVIRWAFDHRLHHAHTDTDEDPYSIKSGFWYAHILWIFKKPQAIDPKVVPDLLNNPLLRFQDRYYEILMLATNLSTCAFFGWLFNDYWGGFVMIGLVRLFALHHSTWFINSLAHTWGWKPFCQEQSAVDNFFLSLVTFGEGYHNYHHTFANDYRNGIRWYHFDPTKWLIWSLSKLGLTYQLRQTDPYVIRRRMVLEHKTLLLERIERAWDQGREELSQRVQDLSEQLLQQLTTLNELRKQMALFKEQKRGREFIAEMGQQLRDAQKNFKFQWRLWRELSRSIERA